MHPCLARALGRALAFALSAPGAAMAQNPTPDAPPSAPHGRPRWEAGLVVGAGRVSDYPGADQSHARALVAPLVIYRGPVLNVDGDGIRGRVLAHRDVELDVAASAAFNARDNDAREGMPGLDYLFGVGPQVVYKGWKRLPGSPAVHLKLKALFSTDFRRLDGRGASFEPELRWRFGALGGAPASLVVGVQPAWASRELHRYFYQVSAQEAAAGRPAYRARAGYLGTEIKLTLSRRMSESLSWFVAARTMSLHGSANAASPLLRSDTGMSLGAGVLWTPWRSRERVPG